MIDILRPSFCIFSNSFVILFLGRRGQGNVAEPQVWRVKLFPTCNDSTPGFQPSFAELLKPGCSREGRGSSLVARACSSEPFLQPHSLRKTSQYKKQCGAGWNLKSTSSACGNRDPLPSFLTKSSDSRRNMWKGKNPLSLIMCSIFFPCSYVTLSLVFSPEKPRVFCHQNCPNVNIN